MVAQSFTSTANAADLVPIHAFDVFEIAINNAELGLRAKLDTSTDLYKSRYDEQIRKYEKTYHISNGIHSSVAIFSDADI